MTGEETKIETEHKLVHEKVRLDKAFVNYNKVIDKKLPYKFAYLDEWILKKSKFLLRESEEVEKTNKKSKTHFPFRYYARGTLVKVDFGVGLGSEMSQVHFAIVLNKYDNPKNNILTVVPLTSKASKFNLDLGGLVINKLIEKVNKELIKIGLDEETKLIDIKNQKDEAKVQKLSTLLSYYKSNIKNTYACCSLVTTISKSRIFAPINEYDIIGKARCSDEVMNKIDNEIVSRFTNINNKN